MNNKYVISLTSSCLIFFIMVRAHAAADTELKRKVDSLFVIASSGEVKYQELTGPAMDSIAALGAEVTPILIDKFTTKSASERWTVLWILQRIGSPAVPYLIDALKRPESLVVQRVCGALGDLKDTTAVNPLTDVATHSRWQVREQAVGALGKIGDQRGGEAVMLALNDPIGEVRKAAVVSCGQLSIEGSIAQLIHALGDDFYGARLGVVDALLKMDTAQVIAALADSLNSENGLVGNLGCYILGELGTDEALGLLMLQTGSNDADRRAHAAMAIIKADPDDNCGYHTMLLEHETDRLNRLKMESTLRLKQNVR
jgi:HEAT repeat protein